MSEEDKGFEVRDRRTVREDQGEPGPGAQEQQAEEPAQETPGGGTASAEAGGEAHEEHELPPVDFLSFVGSLAATAFMYLGERVAPEQQETFVDLTAARQMIDLLDLIKTKTMGNLEQHEAEGLDSILYTLRMRYLHTSGK